MGKKALSVTLIAAPQISAEKLEFPMGRSDVGIWRDGGCADGCDIHLFSSQPNSSRSLLTIEPYHSTTTCPMAMLIFQLSTMFVHGNYNIATVRLRLDTLKQSLTLDYYQVGCHLIWDAL